MFDSSAAGGATQASGVWTLVGGAPVLIEAATEGPPVVLVPTESVLLLAADLPLPTKRQRLAALPFAVEDSLAEPLEASHIALGAELSPRRHLVGVVKRSLMTAWTDRLNVAGFQQYVLTPDIFVLPAPAPGFWSVELTQGRMLVRTEEGGFAAPLAVFRIIWAAEGHPPLAAVGDLPADLSDTTPLLALGGVADRLRASPLDLRQGDFAAPARAVSPSVRLFFAVAAVALVAHAAIAIADTLSLQRQADDSRAEAQTLLQAAAPGASLDAETLARLNRESSDVSGGGAFLPLFARTMQAVEPMAGQIAVQNVSYAGQEGVLAMKVEAPDLAGLQRMQAALADAGLRPVSGASSAEAGRAQGEVSVRAAGAVR